MRSNLPIESLSVASPVSTRIEAAVNQLLAEKKPLTRRSIAELAGCQVRTVSAYKHLWKAHAPEYANAKPANERVQERLPFEKRVAELESCDVTSMKSEQLQSYSE